MGRGSAPWSPTRRQFLRGAGIAAAGATAAALTGCAASVRGSGTVLQVVSHSSELDDELIAGFERANPDIRISLIQASWDVVVTMLAAGTPPDLVRGSGASDTSFLVARDLAEPLDDHLDRSALLHRADLDPVNDLWRHDGRTQGVGPYFGLCKDYSCDLTLWVEKDHLDAAGVALPSVETPLSYAQVLAIAKQTNRVSGGRSDVLGFGSVFAGKPDFGWLHAMMASAGASPFSPDGAEVDLTVPAGLAAIDWFLELIAADVTPSFIAPQSIDDTGLYVAGRVAMLQSGYWTTGLVGDADPAVRAASHLLPAPQLGSTRVSPCLGGTGMWIPKQSSNKQAAWRFMEYYFAGPPAVERAKSGWGTPSLRSLVPLLPTAEPFQQRSLATQLAESRYFKVLPFTPYARADALGTALSAAFEPGFRARRGAARIAAEATRTMNALLAQARKKV